MELIEAIEKRHSVRAYLDKPIEDEKVSQLNDYIEKCNEDGQLNMQLVLNENKAFDSFIAHYGKFSNVKNYIAVIGDKGEDLFERCGYYGEQVVLFAQQLGLNTCWVAMSYSKSKVKALLKNNEKLCFAIAIGYGATEGVQHKSKKYSDVAHSNLESVPTWFSDGIEAALKAPTAMNQQKFTFSLLENDTVVAKAGTGFYTKTDLGIAKYHFEIGAGDKKFSWG